MFVCIFYFLAVGACLPPLDRGKLDHVALNFCVNVYTCMHTINTGERKTQTYRQADLNSFDLSTKNSNEG